MAVNTSLTNLNDFVKILEYKSNIQLTPCSLELNGVAERLNRTLFEKARSMIAEAQMDKKFWGEALNTATYVTNRSPTRALNVNKTPAEIWFGKTPNLSNVFGSTAHAHIPDALRTKLDNKSNPMTMVGYAKNGYRLWNSDVSRIVICRDVKFDECNCKFKKNSHSIVEVEKCEVQAESMSDRFLDEENEEMTVFALNAMAYVDDVPQKFTGGVLTVYKTNNDGSVSKGDILLKQ